MSILKTKMRVKHEQATTKRQPHKIKPCVVCYKSQIKMDNGEWLIELNFEGYLKLATSVSNSLADDSSKQGCHFNSSCFFQKW